MSYSNIVNSISSNNIIPCRYEYLTYSKMIKISMQCRRLMAENVTCISYMWNIVYVIWYISIAFILLICDACYPYCDWISAYLIRLTTIIPNKYCIYIFQIQSWNSLKVLLPATDNIHYFLVFFMKIPC